METIERLTIPLLAGGEYTEWAFKMVDNLDDNIGNPATPTDTLVKNVIVYLVRSDREYNKVYEIFLNRNYLDVDNRTEMEDALVTHQYQIGKMMLHLIRLMKQLEITPFIIQEFYQKIIKEQNLNVLQGAHEPFNLSLQIGHWENYIVSEVGWSLRGAFNIVPPFEASINKNRLYVGNRISNDSVYVMRIKCWDITVKLMELKGLTSKAKINIKAMEIWGAVFNYLNYIDTKPLQLYNMILEQYTNTINLMEKNASNK